MTLLVTRPRRSLAMFPSLGMPAMSGVPVDVEETDDAFLIDLDLPNAAPEDVRIELRDNEIRVFGTFREKERTGLLRHQARRTGEFEYLISLPGDVDPEAVEADLDSGVLSIKAPKARGSQARRIEVHGKRSERPNQQGSNQQGQSQQGSNQQGQSQQGSNQQGQSQHGSNQQDKPPANTPAAQAKQMKEGQSRPGPASQQVGTSGTGSTGQVGRSSMR
jgi:HSP20 family protein